MEVEKRRKKRKRGENVKERGKKQKERRGKIKKESFTVKELILHLPVTNLCYATPYTITLCTFVRLQYSISCIMIEKRQNGRKRVPYNSVSNQDRNQIIDTFDQWRRQH